MKLKIRLRIQNPSRWESDTSRMNVRRRDLAALMALLSHISYNVIGIPMQKESGDIWKVRVAMIGGGSCKWTLSAVNLGIEYIDATHFGKDLVIGTAVRGRLLLIVMFLVMENLTLSLEM